MLENRIPSAPLLLGWAGVIPFAGLALFALVGVETLPLARVSPVAALAFYGASILSFMGGAQWGITVRAEESERAKAVRYGIAVLPALVAWACLLLLSPRGALVGLALGFAALVFDDLASVRAGLAPPWYGRLRVQLTVAAVLALLVAALG